MPARWLSLAIIAFWLGTNGWLFWRELWPHLRAGQPPDYTIDLVEEVQTRRPETFWTVEQDGHKVDLQLRTQVQRLGADSFEWFARFDPDPHPVVTGKAPPSRIDKPPASASWCRVVRVRSTYAVSLAAGDVRALDVKVEGAANLPGMLAVLKKSTFTSRVHGAVQDGKWSAVLEMTSAGGKRRVELPGADVGRGGSVLFPLHPPNRIRGLWPGRRWRVLLVDPLAEVLGVMMHTGAGPSFLSARVAAGLEVPPQGGHMDREEPCHVIEYEGENARVRTWVEERTGLVVRQEATLDGKRWVLYRD
jgi:hypothetical protein